jgi:hypothetical protein
MTDWFRSWHGAPTDPKWRTVARRAGVRPGDVTAVAWLLLDRASQAKERGSIAGYDAEVIADALGYEPDEVLRIIAALHEKGILADDKFASWHERQPSREDASTDRVRAFRERQKRDETPVKRDETQRNAPEERREETDTEKEGRRAQVRALMPLKRVFPSDGSVAYTDWITAVIRKHQPGRDVDIVASAFRRWCHERDIDFADPTIEKVLATFCQKHRVAA